LKKTLEAGKTPMFMDQNIMKIVILSKVIQIQSNSIKIPVAVFMELGKTISKCIWKYKPF
jgi:hypothetical protein